MGETKIEWADVVWNPVTGCTKVGAGCKHCYAERMFARLSQNPKAPKYQGRTFGDVACHEDVLEQPMQWRKSRVVFVNSMGDLFHDAVPDEFIQSVFVRMSMSNRHTYIVLTKRPERMRAWTTAWCGCCEPSPNIVLGVSCSNQREADKAVHELRATPAACRVVSMEPLLGPVDVSPWVGKVLLPSQHSLGNWPMDGLSGVIVGGESGPGARPMHPDWVRSLRDQCADAGVPFFFKQWGEWSPKSHGAVAAGNMPWGCLSHNGTFTEGATTWNGRQEEGPDRESTVVRVGKRRAGRLLDGVTHDALPWRVEG